jgi:hypothetical protein
MQAEAAKQERLETELETNRQRSGGQASPHSSGNCSATQQQGQQPQAMAAAAAARDSAGAAQQQLHYLRAVLESVVDGSGSLVAPLLEDVQHLMRQQPSSGETDYDTLRRLVYYWAPMFSGLEKVETGVAATAGAVLVCLAMHAPASLSVAGAARQDSLADEATLQAVLTRRTLGAAGSQHQQQSPPRLLTVVSASAAAAGAPVTGFSVVAQQWQAYMVFCTESLLVEMGAVELEQQGQLSRDSAAEMPRVRQWLSEADSSDFATAAAARTHIQQWWKQNFRRILTTLEQASTRRLLPAACRQHSRL